LTLIFEIIIEPSLKNYHHKLFSSIYLKSKDGHDLHIKNSLKKVLDKDNRLIYVLIRAIKRNQVLINETKK